MKIVLDPICPKNGMIIQIHGYQLDINSVMEQYEDAYPKFQYLGANPIDFDTKISKGKCVSNELCNINIKDIKKDGKDTLGMSLIRILTINRDNIGSPLYRFKRD